MNSDQSGDFQTPLESLIARRSNPRQLKPGTLPPRSLLPKLRRQTYHSLVPPDPFALPPPPAGYHSGASTSSAARSPPPHGPLRANPRHLWEYTPKGHELSRVADHRFTRNLIRQPDHQQDALQRMDVPPGWGESPCFVERDFSIRQHLQSTEAPGSLLDIDGGYTEVAGTAGAPPFFELKRWVGRKGLPRHQPYQQILHNDDIGPQRPLSAKQRLGWWARHRPDLGYPTSTSRRSPVRCPTPIAADTKNRPTAAGACSDLREKLTRKTRYGGAPETPPLLQEKGKMSAPTGESEDKKLRRAERFAEISPQSGLQMNHLQDRKSIDRKSAKFSEKSSEEGTKRHGTANFTITAGMKERVPAQTNFLFTAVKQDCQVPTVKRTRITQYSLTNTVCDATAPQSLVVKCSNSSTDASVQRTMVNETVVLDASVQRAMTNETVVLDASVQRTMVNETVVLDASVQRTMVNETVVLDASVQRTMVNETVVLAGSRRQVEERMKQSINNSKITFRTQRPAKPSGLSGIETRPHNDRLQTSNDRLCSPIKAPTHKIESTPEPAMSIKPIAGPLSLPQTIHKKPINFVSTSDTLSTSSSSISVHNCKDSQTDPQPMPTYTPSFSQNESGTNYINENMANSAPQATTANKNAPRNIALCPFLNAKSASSKNAADRRELTEVEASDLPERDSAIPDRHFIAPNLTCAPFIFSTGPAASNSSNSTDVRHISPPKKIRAGTQPNVRSAPKIQRRPLPSLKLLIPCSTKIKTVSALKAPILQSASSVPRSSQSQPVDNVAAGRAPGSPTASPISPGINLGQPTPVEIAPRFQLNRTPRLAHAESPMIGTNTKDGSPLAFGFNIERSDSIPFHRYSHETDATAPISLSLENRADHRQSPQREDRSVSGVMYKHAEPNAPCASEKKSTSKTEIPNSYLTAPNFPVTNSSSQEHTSASSAASPSHCSTNFRKRSRGHYGKTTPLQLSDDAIRRLAEALYEYLMDTKRTLTESCRADIERYVM